MKTRTIAQAFKGNGFIALVMDSEQSEALRMYLGVNSDNQIREHFQKNHISQSEADKLSQDIRSAEIYSALSNYSKL